MAGTAATRQIRDSLPRHAVMISTRPGAAANVDYLRARGFDVSLMRDGAAANEQVLAQHPPLVIVDTGKDHAAGLDLLEKARSNGSATGFIVISADNSLDCAIRAMQLGALDFLPEPFQPGRLAALMRRALGLPEENDTLQLSGEIDAFLEDAGHAPVLRNICTIIERAAYGTAHVRISGGDAFIREICARALHDCGPRRNRPFIAMNCTAIPKSLIESELFGHAKGAFHGAVCDRAGLATDAHGGTLFLDGISELELGVQKKMHRFAEHGTFQRVGCRVLEQTDTRLVCGWPSDPEPDVRNSRLRPDLYQRLSGISLILPPAEECRAESLKIARRFLFRASAREEPSHENDAEAVPRSWPGDARELQKTLESAMKHSL